MTTETQVAQPPRALDGRQLPGDGWSPRLHSCAPGVLGKAHLAFLKRTKTPGAVIFVDASAAYYSITRDLVSLTAQQRRDVSFLWRRASLLFADTDLQQRFVQMAQRDEAAPALHFSVHHLLR